MGTVPSPTSDWPAATTGSVALPLLAVTFLLGIGLVSLIDAFGDDTETVPPLVVPVDLADLPLVVVAPGWEEAIAGLPEPERVTLRPVWERLPEIGWQYTVALAEGGKVPRLPDGWEVVGDHRAGAWRLVEVRNAEQTDVEANAYELADHIDTAHVSLQAPDGSSIACDRWRFGRWSCGLEEWMWVGPTEQVIRNRPQSCIWAHPKAGYDLVIRFPAVPRGTRLVGRYGLSDSAVEVPDGAPVELTVRAGGSERTVVAENRPGFTSYQLRLDDAEPDRLDVEFIVTAERDGRRHFCFDGTMQGIGAVRLREQSDGGAGEGAGAESPDDRRSRGAERRPRSLELRIPRPSNGTGAAP